jgi:hypothetical protein
MSKVNWTFKARHLHFDRDGDVALDLLGRLTGILGHDLDQRRHRVGIGFDVQLFVCKDAAHDQGDAENQNQNTLLKSCADNCLHAEPCCEARTLRGPLPGHQL